MDARIVHLQTLFGDQVSYQIPQFQRPYAWGEGEQWFPLWEDVRNLAERRLATDGQRRVKLISWERSSSNIDRVKLVK